MEILKKKCAAPGAPQEIAIAAKPTPLIEQRADPFICRHSDGYYYFTASVPKCDRIELRRAKTIEGLASASMTDVWHKPDTGPCSESIRAPQIHHLHDAWHIYFVAQHRLYAIRNTHPNPLAGAWEFAGEVTAGMDVACLGATTFAHDGVLFHVWIQEDDAAEGGTSLWISRMETPSQLAGKPVRLGNSGFSAEQSTINLSGGPAVFKRRGKIYIGLSAGAAEEEHAIGVQWVEDSADLLDPASWRTTGDALQRSCREHGIRGPAHNSFTIAEDGGTVMLVYDARTGKGGASGNPDRHTFVEPLQWDDDDLPRFGLRSSANRRKGNS
jgi:GH43 family beta-xylosidase